MSLHHEDIDESSSAGKISDIEPEPRKEDDIVREFELLQNDPAAFRIRIAAYTPHVTGTSVPESFRNFEPSDIVPGSTFLSLVVSCIPTWWQKAHPRRTEKLDSKKSHLHKAERHLDWLLEFGRDYIKHTRSSLHQEDIRAIASNVIEFCKKATNEKELNYSIEILFEIAKHIDYPEDVLREITSIMAGAANALSHTPEPLRQYLHSIMTGDKSHICISSLEDLIAHPTLENGFEGTSYAKGACKLLGMAIDHQNARGDYVAQIPHIIQVLHHAATHRNFRLNRDILSACESILASSHRRQEVLTNGFSEILEAAELCLQANPVPEGESVAGRHATNTSSHGTSAEATNRNSVEAQLVRRAAQAQLFGHQLHQLWIDLGEIQRIEVADFVLRNAKDNPEAFVLLILEFVFEKELWRPPSIDWEARMSLLKKNFVSEPQVFLTARTTTILWLGQHFKGPDTPALDDLAGKSTPRGDANDVKLILKTFRDQLCQEKDKDVVEALALAIRDTVQASICDEGVVAEIQTTVQTLSNFVLNQALLPAAAVHVSRCLVAIFDFCFRHNSRLSPSTFGALVDIAGVKCPSSEARIVALCVLLRLRSTGSDSVYLTGDTESQYVAEILCRTAATASAAIPEPRPSRHSTSSSSISSSSVTAEPSWVYGQDGSNRSDFVPPSSRIITRRIDTGEDNTHFRLDLGAWLIQAVTILQTDTDWETYSYLLVHLSSQLGNVQLFRHSLGAIIKLRQVICEQIANQSFRPPPSSTGLTKSDVALCFFNILTPLIAYGSIEDPEIDKAHFGKELVQAFMAGMNDTKFDGAFRGCVHALSVCSLEFPEQVGREYPRILDNMSRMTTKSHWSIHMLEFLSQVAMLPEVHRNFSPEDCRQIFGICIAVLKDQRDKQIKQQDQQEHGVTSPAGPRAATPSRYSGLAVRRPPYRAQMLEDVQVPLYGSALAYHTMICWFLSLDLEVRPAYASEIVQKLIWHNKQNEPTIDQQAEVFRDMMLRTAYSDLGETSPDPAFMRLPATKDTEDGSLSDPPDAVQTDGNIRSSSWLVGYSIVTVETAVRTGRTQITKRQASGTTFASYQQSTRHVPPHQQTSHTPAIGDGDTIQMLPQHVMLQLQATAAPLAVEEQPIPLPDHEAVDRAVRLFDLQPTIDTHKAGVLYIGPGQEQQAEILSVQSGSPDFEQFVVDLGSRVSLKPPNLLYNPQGLRYPLDGDETVAWCDRVTEMVFMVSTMMPLDLAEEQTWMRRWANIGNCYVNIIFNESGRSWKQGQLQSQFNYVNIVITPADWDAIPEDRPQSRASYYQVHVVTKDGFPNISPAADPKVLSRKSLAKFVRVLAVGACVFSQAWEKKDSDTEFHSPWRDRLNAIKDLRARYGKESAQHPKKEEAGASTPQFGPVALSASAKKTPLPREDTAGDQGTSLLSSLDFTRWVGHKSK